MTNTERLAEARRLGQEGAPATEGERLLFEAWMRGHCWALCATWDGRQYVSDAEQGGNVDPRAMNTRQIFAAWRDRAALAAHEAAAESASIEEWEQELSAVMPEDFKDWWQNSKREWPAVAAAVIRSQREDRDLGWEMAAKAAPAAGPLTDEQIDAMAHKEGDYDSRTCCWSFNGDPDCRYNLTNFARAIERACSEKWGVQLASGGEVQK